MWVLFKKVTDAKPLKKKKKQNACNYNLHVTTKQKSFFKLYIIYLPINELWILEEQKKNIAFSISYINYSILFMIPKKSIHISVSCG